jgi:hypothetical protein
VCLANPAAMASPPACSPPAAKRAKGVQGAAVETPHGHGCGSTPDCANADVELLSTAVSRIIARQPQEAHVLLSERCHARPHGKSVEDVLVFGLCGFAQRQLRQHSAADESFSRGSVALKMFSSACLNGEEGVRQGGHELMARFPAVFLAAVLATAGCLSKEEILLQPWQLFALGLDALNPPEKGLGDLGGAVGAPSVHEESEKSGKEDVGGPWVMGTEKDITCVVHKEVGTTLVLLERRSFGVFSFAPGEGAEKLLCGASGEALAGVETDELNDDMVKSVHAEEKRSDKDGAGGPGERSYLSRCSRPRSQLRSRSRMQTGRLAAA